jgi:transposase
MRGTDQRQQGMFSYVSLEARVPKEHPLRPVREMVDEALREMSGEFSRMYSSMGRPSIPPERLLRASILQILYGIRSERMLMEQMDYNLLFRWFVGLNMDDPVWDPTTFTKNRDRFLCGEVSRKFLDRVLAQAGREKLLSDEHFTVDGTLIEAWASMKSVKPKDGSGGLPLEGGRNPSVEFRGEKRTNETHGSTTDPQARLYRKAKGKETKLCYMGHALMENRHGLVTDTEVTEATGTAEREAAAEMVSMVRGNGRITVGGDKAFDTQAFVQKMRELGATPHVAQNTFGRRSAIDGRTTRHRGYEVSQRVRKRVEEIFGWVKAAAGMRKTKYRGVRRVGWMFTLAAAAYNLVRMRNLGVAAC